MAVASAAASSVSGTALSLSLPVFHVCTVHFQRTAHALGRVCDGGGGWQRRFRKLRTRFNHSQWRCMRCSRYTCECASLFRFSCICVDFAQAFNLSKSHPCLRTRTRLLRKFVAIPSETNDNARCGCDKYLCKIASFTSTLSNPQHSLRTTSLPMYLLLSHSRRTST